MTAAGTFLRESGDVKFLEAELWSMLNSLCLF